MDKRMCHGVMCHGHMDGVMCHGSMVSRMCHGLVMDVSWMCHVACVMDKHMCNIKLPCYERGVPVQADLAMVAVCGRAVAGRRARAVPGRVGDPGVGVSMRLEAP